MKVIDLLNKIANGKEVPKKIIYDNTTFYYHPEYRELIRYVNKDKRDDWKYLLYCVDYLNDEVEIIEEDKEIEKIIINSLGNIEKKLIDGSTIVLSTNKDEILHIAYKLNDLIDEVNKLKN